jgi:hypothetical protein
MAGMLAMFVFAGCVTRPVSTPMTTRFSMPGVVIPLYVYPGDDGRHVWDQVAGAARRFPHVPVIVVVNPSNGPGQVADPNYRSVVRDLSDAGVELVAYVPLGYGRRPVREVHSDLRRWRRLYRGVPGVFFDEVPVPGDDLPRREARRYVTDVSAYSRARGFSGTIIGNPGTAAPRDYSAPGAFDLVVIHEDRRWPDDERVTGGPRPDRTVVLVYGDGVWDRSRARRTIEDGRFLFVDDHSLDITGTGGSPWTHFPSNLVEQIELIEEYGEVP